MQPFLLDTCAVIWMAEDEELAPKAVAELNFGHAEGVATYISPISAWEVGLLVSRARLQLLITPQRWFQRVLDTPNVRLADMSADLLIASSFLPGRPPNDPADRIIAATAREYGATLVTRDRNLLSYAEQGHIRALAC